MTTQPPHLQVTLSLLLVVGALALGPAPAAAEEAEQVRLAAGVFDFNRRQNVAMEIGGQYRAGHNTWLLHPLAGGTVTTDGALHAYAGFGFDVPISSGLVLRPSFAPGFYRRGGGKDLGAALEYRSAVELAWHLAGGRRLGLEIYHISNASAGRINPGAESLLVTFAFPLGKR